MHPFEYSRLVFLGMVGSMMLYNSLKFLQLRDFTYFYYTGYLLCMITYFSRSYYLDINNSYFQYELNAWLSVVAPMFSYIFYYGFAITFLDLRKNIPILFKFSKWMVILIATFIVFFTFSKVILKNQNVSFLMHDFMRLLLIIASIYGIIKTYMQKKVISNYFATGSAALTLGGAIAFVMSMNFFENGSDITLFESPLFYFECGIIIEIFCFSLGLAYKQRQIEMAKGRVEEALFLQTKSSEIEQIRAVLDARELERNRISKELHDDLGSGLTEIRLLSEVLKSKSDNGISIEIEKISKASSKLIDNLSEIVWTMNPRHDLLESLIVYLRTYSIEYFENTNVQFKTNIPEEIPTNYLSSEVRRNIFLVVKESFNNIVKHSYADAVTFNIEIVHVKQVKDLPMKQTSEDPFYEFKKNAVLQITIADNGIGINFDNQNLLKNGLKNMHERMKYVGGTFEIFNQSGTKTILSYPLETSLQAN
jgi:signal transduction histidine kinase